MLITGANKPHVTLRLLIQIFNADPVDVLVVTTSNINTHIMVNLSLWLSNYALRHEDVWGSGCTEPHILDCGTSWK
jgi:hypothetical protein